MPRLYTVSFTEQSITTANGDHDLFELVPASNRPVEIIALSLGNKSEVGDAQDEMVGYAIIRGNTTSGTGGTATTPQPLNSADPAAGFTAETLNTGIATAGTAVTLLADTFNIRAGLNLIFPEIMRPRCNSGDSRIVVRMPTALADDATFSGTVWVQEV